nr:hypothetical protein [Desulfosporosinus metallidurans]
MNSDIKSERKKGGSDPAPPRQIFTVPLPKDTVRCEGCPYPRVGFICWDPDGTCLRTYMDRISRPRR